MMIISSSGTQQDTVQIRNVVLYDSIATETDSVSIVKLSPPKDSVVRTEEKFAVKSEFKIIDTTSVCSRNSVADITFYKSDNFITKIGPEPFNKFPFLFTGKNRQMKIDAITTLTKQLKPGQHLPVQPLHDDWIIGIILFAAFIYSLIRTASRDMLPGATRFFLFRGINDPSSRDVERMFHWQSALHNLFSFIIIGLFAYYAVVYYDFNPAGIRGILLWLVFVGVIIIAVTVRHFVCYLTGIISGEKEVFREYLTGIYQSYRFGALFLFGLVILTSYTVILPAGISITAGVIVFGLMYLMRVIRLLMIFIIRNISIFYLILYLCGLEILPVLISVKYITGLI